jgi:hypothetical protein
MDKIYNLYAHLFGRVIFLKLNRFLYHLSLRGLGVLNHQNDYLTGEKIWLKKYLKDKSDPLIIDVGANVGNYSKMNIVSHSTFKDFWDLLSKNYKLYRIVNSNFLIEIKKYHPLRNEIYGYQNIIAKLK